VTARMWRIVACSCATFALYGTLASSGAAPWYTTPVGVFEVQIAPGSMAIPAVTAFSIPLRSEVPADFTGQASGRISGVLASSITCTSAGWQPGALSQASRPFFLRITSGNARGRTLLISSGVSNTSDTVTVLNQGTDLTGLGITVGESGDSFEIFPGHTLSSFFGTSTLGAASPDAADTVLLHNGVGWRTYYFNSTVGQWRTGSFPLSQNNVVIRPDDGVLFYRRGSSPLAYTLWGTVPSVDLKIVVRNLGVTFVGGVYPVEQTLNSAAYNTLSNWRTAGDISTADKVTIYEGVGFKQYNYNLSAGQWRRGSFPLNQNNVVIPAGTPVIIERTGGASGISILERPLPYTL